MTNYFKTIILLFLACSISSCSIDDDSGNESTGNIVGTWEMVSLDYNGSTSTTSAGQTISTDFIGQGQNIDYIIEFTENPNAFNAQGSYDVELTTTFLGETSSQVITVGDVSGSGTYSINGSTLSVDGDLVSIETGGLGEEVSGDVTISQLTDSTLILTQGATQEQTIGGNSVLVTFTSETVFTRL